MSVSTINSRRDSRGTPRAFGKFHVLATIARGGMGYVHLAAIRGARGFKKVVVIKELAEELVGEDSFRNMFLQEANLAAQLTHPNIVQTFEAGEEHGRMFIVMEYLEGQPLNRIRKKLSADEFLQCQLLAISDMLAGLAQAHALTDYDGTPLNVVHRDISPHNVFVTYAGEVKVVDFGIAKAANQLGGETKTGTIKGKIAYMPPEQAIGRGIDCRADLFAAGIMVFEAVTGTRFWAGTEELTAFGMLLRSELPDWKPAVTRQAPSFLPLLSRALAPDPAQRFGSATEFREQLDELRKRSNAIPDRGDLGRLIATHFAAERREMAELIREQLAAIEEGGDPVSAEPPPRVSEISQAVPRGVRVPTPMPPPLLSGPTSVRPASISSESATMPAATLPQLLTIDAPVESSRISRTNVLAAGLALIVVVLIIFGVLILQKLDHSGVATRPTPTAPDAVPAADSAKSAPLTTQILPTATAMPTGLPTGLSTAAGTAAPTAKPSASVKFAFPQGHPLPGTKHPKHNGDGLEVPY